MRIVLVGSSREAQEPLISLFRARGYEVFSFTNSQDALARLRSDAEIDVLITSADVSPISGVELCWETRLMAGPQRTIYVLLMSPAGDRATKIEALDCGADEIIDEPPHPDELLAKLRVAERMMTLKRELIRKASTDPLSGVYNRGAFFGKLTAACREAKDGASLCVIFLDVDRFKAINDRYGHDVGDQAIRAVANVAQNLDVPVGRLGGDEFSILLEGHSLNEALEVASELRSRFSEVQLETAEGSIGLTCSLGVSEFHTGDTADDLMKRADLALYRAKDEGGNHVATTPSDSWMNGRPRLGVSLARLLPRPSEDVKERRNRRPGSERLVARVCAVMDLLIASGLSEEIAAQTMAQRLIAAGIPVPTEASGDWCRCLLARREAFRDGAVTDEVLKEYQSVVAALESVAPYERVEWALANELWDRRRLVSRPHKSLRATPSAASDGFMTGSALDHRTAREPDICVRQ